MVLVAIRPRLFQTQRPSKSVCGSQRPLVHLGAKTFLRASQSPTIAGSRGFPNLLSKSQNIMEATGAKEPSDRLEQFLKVAISAAEMAGGVISDAWDKTKVVEHKGAVDLVTNTDKQCEALILETIQTNFPDHTFIGEETSASQGFSGELTAQPTWMVDPVDGTTNFVHRFPFSCVSIGLAIDRKVVVGVVYNPILKEMFYAKRGSGAYLNGHKIHCSETKELGHALIASELGTRRDDKFLDAAFTRMRLLAKHSRSLRACGSCALNLCSVAMGRLDAYYEIGLGGVWDVAAASLILEEAGGKVLDPAGGEFELMSRRVLGTNSSLATAVSSILSAGPWAPGEPLPPTSST